MKLKIKKCHREAKIPKYAREDDGCIDLTAVDREFDHGNGCVSYSTGLAFEIPSGFVGLLFPRSSIYKKSLTLSNSVGVLDAGFRGVVSFKFKLEGNKLYEIGDRIGQLMVIPRPLLEIEEVKELSESERGEGGYGSSGA